MGKQIPHGLKAVRNDNSGLAPSQTGTPRVVRNRAADPMQWRTPPLRWVKRQQRIALRGTQMGHATAELPGPGQGGDPSRFASSVRNPARRDGPQRRCLGPWLASVAQPWRAISRLGRQHGEVKHKERSSLTKVGRVRLRRCHVFCFPQPIRNGSGQEPALGTPPSLPTAPFSQFFQFRFHCSQQFGESASRSKLTPTPPIRCVLVQF